MTLVWQKSVNHIWQNLKIRKYFNRWAAQNAASLNKNWRKAAPHLLNSRKCNWVGGDYSRVGSNLVPKATNGTQSRLKSKIGMVFWGAKMFTYFRKVNFPQAHLQCPHLLHISFVWNPRECMMNAQFKARICAQKQNGAFSIDAGWQPDLPTK